MTTQGAQTDDLTAKRKAQQSIPIKIPDKSGAGEDFARLNSLQITCFKNCITFFSVQR